MAVDLRGRERAVAEQFLDDAEIGPALDEVSGERVAEAVRVGEEPPQGARVEPAAPHREKQRYLGSTNEAGPPLAEIERKPVRCLLSERDDALLAALAPHVQRLLLEVDVSEVEVDRLAAAEAGRVDELEQGAVAERERPVAVEALEQPVELVGLRRMR